jgi:antibiotic biosynthesis monooxygenase (ABM) superfamily enzyme
MTTKVSLRAGQEVAFAAWQSALTRAVSAASGFVSLEIAPAFAESAEWWITQRFRSAQSLALWRSSDARARLMAELDRMRDDSAPLDEAVPDFHPLSCVTEVITTVVEPGREGEFQAWAEAVQAKQAVFPGYMGTLVQAPLSPDVAYWTTLVRFSTPEQLDAWLGSEERKALLEKSDPRVSRFKSQRLANPFPGWFPTEPDRAPPAAWKQSMLVLLVLFPVVMLEIRFLSPLLAGLNGVVSTFIGNAISVALTSWPLIQIAQYSLGWWLQPDPASKLRSELLGAGTVVALYALEIWIFLLFR